MRRDGRSSVPSSLHVESCYFVLGLNRSQEPIPIIYIAFNMFDIEACLVAFVRSNFPFDADTGALFGFPVPKKAINCITNDNNLKHHVNVYFCAFKLLLFN
jgi:hypothetical protein